MSEWLAVRFATSAARWPAVEACLDTLEVAAVTQSGGNRPAFGEPGSKPVPSWDRFEVEVLCDEAADLAAIEGALRDVLEPDTAITVTTIASQDWQHTWKSHWQPLEFGNGLCVCPSWCEPPPTAREIISIDPGQAFGTGTHESTALCLQWLAAHPPNKREVVDYGCGSAVLALAAARLGARSVLAVDIDPVAIDVAKANIAANELTDRVRVVALEALEPGNCDLLIANILLEPLLELEPRLAALVRPGGRLLLAGVLTTQAAELEAAYAADFDLRLEATRGDWALMVGKRRAARRRGD